MNLKVFITIAKKAFLNLSDKNPLLIAGATSFFTTFALPPIFVILIQAIIILYNQGSVKKGVFTQVSSVLGKDGSKNIYNTLNQFQQISHNWLFSVAGFIFLLFVSTTLFNIVRKSVNDIWCIKIKKHAGFMFYLKLRLKSLIIVVFAGLLMAV